jgi:hypothetical protein
MAATDAIEWSDCPGVEIDSNRQSAERRRSQAPESLSMWLQTTLNVVAPPRDRGNPRQFSLSLASRFRPVLDFFETFASTVRRSPCVTPIRAKRSYELPDSEFSTESPE